MMAAGLPNMVYSDGISRRKQVSFSGYDHNLSAENGALWDMKNLTGDYLPLLSPRPPRWKARTLTKPNGIYARDGLFWVDGTAFYAQGELKGTVTNSPKRFTGLGAYVVILPDKKYYNTLTGDFGAIEAQWSGAAVIRDGTYAGEQAGANTIYCQNAGWSGKFKPGDALDISGSAHAENNKTAVVREIEGDELRFYENCFTTGTETALTIKRSMPDLDFICENENRLWGCRGDTIYASKLGDIFNWNVFDGLSTDSYAADVGSAGDFTACCSYMGYPCFFKEEHIYKVYGDKPSNFQVMGSASAGVEKGSDRSLAIAGETLYYLSRTGITAWTGGVPQNMARAFGTDRYRNAVGGSDGTKYYVSMEGTDGERSLFVLDTRSGLWHREDDTKALGFAWDGELYCLDAAGDMWLGGNVREVPQGAVREETVEWMAEWADFYEYSTASGASAAPERKGIGKLLVRLELDEGSSVKIEMQFDGDGVWRTVRELGAEKKQSCYLPIIPRRCDFYRIRMSGTGGCRVYSLVREAYNGSEMF